MQIWHCNLYRNSDKVDYRLQSNTTRKETKMFKKYSVNYTKEGQQYFRGFNSLGNAKVKAIQLRVNGIECFIFDHVKNERVQSCQ